MQDQLFGDMSKSKQRDIFRAWISGRVEYLSNGGYWVKLDEPDTGRSSTYLCACKLYRIVATTQKEELK